MWPNVSLYLCLSTDSSMWLKEDQHYGFKTKLKNIPPVDNPSVRNQRE